MSDYPDYKSFNKLKNAKNFREMASERVKLKYSITELEAQLKALKAYQKEVNQDLYIMMTAAKAEKLTFEGYRFRRADGVVRTISADLLTAEGVSIEKIEAATVSTPYSYVDVRPEPVVVEEEA